MSPWITQSSTIAYAARPFLEVSREEILLPSGRVIPDFHRIWMSDYAILCAETDDGRILLARIYKQGVKDTTLIFPGGCIGEREDPLEAAKRELLEETGYTAREWRVMAKSVVHANYGCGQAHFIHAKGLTKTQDAAVDDTEELVVEFHSRAEVRALMERREIVILDCLAMIGVMGL